MHKTIVMTRLRDKETKGCHRYGFSSGDAGVATIYLRKEALKDGETAPDEIKVTITAEASQ